MQRMLHAKFRDARHLLGCGQSSSRARHASSASSGHQWPRRSVQDSGLDDVRLGEGRDEDDAPSTSGRLHDEPGAMLGSRASAAADEEPLEPGLYVVSTPLGNLEDITLRALRVLRQASTVLAEDTRRTRILLNHYGIRTPSMRFDAHAEKGLHARLTERMAQGEALALVSDAGTPVISDPGGILVRAAADAGVRVVPVPGPCALVAALTTSALPTDQFLFVGFLPPKKGARAKRLQELASFEASLVFYVSPHSLAAVMEDMVAVFGGERRCSVARELTKLHEEICRGTLAQALREFTAGRPGNPRGEFCLVVAGQTPPEAAAALRVAAAAAAAMPGAAGADDDAGGATDQAGGGAAAAPGDMPEPERARFPGVVGGLAEWQAVDEARRLLRGGLSARDAAARLVDASGATRNRCYTLCLEQAKHVRAQAGSPKRAAAPARGDVSE